MTRNLYNTLCLCRPRLDLIPKRGAEAKRNAMNYELFESRQCWIVVTAESNPVTQCCATSRSGPYTGEQRSRHREDAAMGGSHLIAALLNILLEKRDDVWNGFDFDWQPSKRSEPASRCSGLHSALLASGDWDQGELEGGRHRFWQKYGTSFLLPAQPTQAKTVLWNETVTSFGGTYLC